MTPLRVALPEWKHVCLRLVDPRNGTLDFVVNDQLLVSREVKGAGGKGGKDLGVGGTRVGGGGLWRDKKCFSNDTFIQWGGLSSTLRKNHYGSWAQQNS